MSGVLCPVLGTDQKNVITQNNVDSLSLSSYERVPGTVVQISCYLPSLYQLDGPSEVECSANGTWMPSIPKCISKSSSSGGETTDGTPHDTSLTDDAIVSTSTILLIVSSIVAVILLAIVIFIICKMSCLRSRKWETLTEMSDNSSHPGKVVDSGVGPGSYTHWGRTIRSADLKLGSSPPSWHNHPIITSGVRFDSSSWSAFSVDKFLRDMDRSRRENPNHSWRDFATVSTSLSSRTINL